jgi:hypothetical protein
MRLSVRLTAVIVGITTYVVLATFLVPMIIAIGLSVIIAVGIMLHVPGRLWLVGGDVLAIAAGVALLFLIRGDSPSPDDPPTWIFVALAVGAVGFAACSLALVRGRRIIVTLAVPLLLASATCLVSFWMLVLLVADRGYETSHARSRGQLAGLASEVRAVVGCAAALADGLGHVWVQVGHQPRVAGQDDPDGFDGQLADDVDGEVVG